MSVKIGNIVLDEHLQLYGLEESEDILVSQITSFDGTTDTMTMPRSSSRVLSLVATLDGDRLYGSFLLSQLHSIKSIAQSGQPTTLEHHRGIFNVLVESVTNVVPVFDLVDPPDAAEYAATIIMREV